MTVVHRSLMSKARLITLLDEAERGRAAAIKRETYWRARAGAKTLTRPPAFDPAAETIRAQQMLNETPRDPDAFRHRQILDQELEAYEHSRVAAGYCPRMGCRNRLDEDGLCTRHGWRTRRARSVAA